MKTIFNSILERFFTKPVGYCEKVVCIRSDGWLKVGKVYTVKSQVFGWYVLDGEITSYSPKDFVLLTERLVEERDELQAKIKEIHDVLYGENYELSNFHLNGDGKNIDEFFEENDWNPLEIVTPIE